MNKSHVTITDVARVAGVSITTVSRILNGKPDVAPATRQRVLDVIQQLGYTPHAPAQRLAGGSSQAIAVLYPSDSMGFSELEFEFFIGMSEVTGKNSFLFNLMFHRMTESALLNLYRSSQVDGVILMEIHLDDWRPHLLREQGYPFVMIGHCEDNDGISYIDLDFAAGAEIVAHYLSELGHRTIGLIVHPGTITSGTYGPGIRSVRGFELACARYGLTPLIHECVGTIEDAQRVTNAMLDAAPDLTAIYIVHRLDSAVGVVRAVEGRGRRVPEDFSLVCNLSDKVAELVTPPLTAISFPAQLMGARAAQMLIKLLREGASEPSQTLLKPRLVVRGSTARAPQTKA